MSHIPASKMPHAKPHDDHTDHDSPAAAPVTSGPEIKPDVGDTAAPAPKKKPESGAGSSVPYVAIAAVGALAIGGIVAALALRPSEPPPKPAKGKGGRPRKHPKPE